MIDKRREYEYLLLNISLKYSKRRFIIIDFSTFDLHTTYFTLLSSIKEDHVIKLKNIEFNTDIVIKICEFLYQLTELYRMELTNCEINDEDLKMLKEIVKYIPNIKELINREEKCFKSP